MDSKQYKLLLKTYPKSIIDKLEIFLISNKYSLFNFAYLGDGDWRVMYRDEKEKVSSNIFNWGEPEI